MNFQQIFQVFSTSKNHLKIVSIASCDVSGKPNSASKMLVDVQLPNKVFYLDYKFTHTYANVIENPLLSLSFMDDANFTGYRLNGRGKVLHSGVDFQSAKRVWEKRLIRYEADRMLKRITGQHSAREAENTLPDDFVIVRFEAEEGAVIKPDRILRATHGMDVEKVEGEQKIKKSDACRVARATTNKLPLSGGARGMSVGQR